MSKWKRLTITASGTKLRGEDMNKCTVGILGLVIFIVCGDQFQADKNIVLILMIAFVLILLSTEKKG